jgi:hypothetical protein
VGIHNSNGNLTLEFSPDLMGESRIDLSAKGRIFLLGTINKLG